MDTAGAEMKKEQLRQPSEPEKQRIEECRKHRADAKVQPLLLTRHWQTVEGNLDEVLSHSEQYLVCPICGEGIQ